MTGVFPRVKAASGCPTLGAAVHFIGRSMFNSHFGSPETRWIITRIMLRSNANCVRQSFDKEWVVSGPSALIRNGAIAASPLLAKCEVPLNVRYWVESGQSVLQASCSGCCGHRMQTPELNIDELIDLDIHRGMMHRGVMVDKELIAATSRSLTLSILAEGDSYGYSIIQRVDVLTDGQFKWTDSMLYPVLHRLEDQGSASSYWKPSPAGRKRKYYSLTDAGRKELEERQRQWGIAASAFSTLWDG